MATIMATETTRGRKGKRRKRRHSDRGLSQLYLLVLSLCGGTVILKEESYENYIERRLRKGVWGEQERV